MTLLKKHKSYRYPTLGTRTKNVPKVGHPVRCHSEALLGRWGCGRSLSGFCWWRTGFCGRGEDEILADQGEALLGEFGLEKLIFGAGEEIRCGAGDGGDEVVDDDGLAVECALFVGVGGQLNRLDGAGLFGDDGPEVSVVAGNAEGQQSFKGAGVKVGKENGSGVRGQRGGSGVAVGRDVQQQAWGCVSFRPWSGGDGDGRVVDNGAQLDVAEAVGGGEALGFGEGVIEAIHLDADLRGGVIAGGSGGEVEAGRADGLAVLRDGEAA